MQCEPCLRAQLLAAGANDTALTMLEATHGKMLTAGVGAINWATILQLLLTYGPQILALILQLLNPPAPATTPKA